jgi:hypothetical protein
MHMGTVVRSNVMKIIKWRVSALILSWALLGAGLKVINLTVNTIDRATLGCLLIASASYLLATTSVLKPLIKRSV